MARTLEEIDTELLNKMVECVNLKETREQMVKHLAPYRHNKSSPLYHVTKRTLKLVDKEISLVHQELEALEEELVNGAFTV